MKNSRLPLVALTFVLTFTVIIQLAMPHPVLADDTPPPPPSDGEVQPTEPSQPAEDQPTDVHSAEATAEIEQSAEVSPADTQPAETDQSAEIPSVDVVPAEPDQSAKIPPAADVTSVETEQSAETSPADAQPEDMTLSEIEQPAEPIATEAEQPVDAIVTEETPESILDVLPENTDLVVLDANNQPLPLATESAASIIANSDPWWCPGSKSPSTGGCANYATFTDLINGLQSLNHLTNGTVYVQAGKYTGPETWITLDGNSLTNVGNLTLIGGWDLAAATPSQIGTTIFGAPISIINWTHDVSVQDIQINGAKWNGLTIDTTGKASLEDVIANHNVHDGIRVTAGDSITLNDVRASYNGDDGIDLSSDTNTGSITLDHIRTNHNGDDGIHIYSKQKDSISLIDVISNYNGGDGLDLKGPLEAAINCSSSEQFVNTGDIYGDPPRIATEPTLLVTTRCDNPRNQSLSIADSEFNYNHESGMEVSITAVYFGIGLGFDSVPYDHVVASPVYAIGNGQDGAWLNFFPTDPGPFDWNYYQARADQLANGTATVVALRTPQGGTSEGIFSLITTDNGGQDRVVQMGLPTGTTWGFGPPDANGYLSLVAWSPPGSVEIVGGEQIFTGDNQPNSDDAYPGDNGGNPENPPSGGGGESESNSGDKGDTPLCVQNSITILQLPSGNNLTVYCPVSGTLSVKEQTKKGLPAPLPDGLTFVSGIAVTLSQGNTPTQVITDSGHMKPSFVVPTGQTGTPVILYWDAVTKSWVELPAFGVEGSFSLSNGGVVSEGVQLLNNIGQIEVGVNFPGIFVLAFR